MTASRIPELAGTSKKAAKAWLTELHKREMLFCLDDDPLDLFKISDGSRTFTDQEAKEVSELMDRLFEKRGDEMHTLAFETLSKTFHTRAERRKRGAMYG